MEYFEAGMLARSKCGHDAGTVYVIIETDRSCVYLADGRIRTMSNPKKKKKKHVQLIYSQYDITGATDVSIKRFLKEWSRKEGK